MSEDKESNFSTDYEIQELRAERDALRAELEQIKAREIDHVKAVGESAAAFIRERDELRAKLAEIETARKNVTQHASDIAEKLVDQSATIEKMRAALDKIAHGLVDPGVIADEHDRLTFNSRMLGWCQAFAAEALAARKEHPNG